MRNTKTATILKAIINDIVNNIQSLHTIEIILCFSFVFNCDELVSLSPLTKNFSFVSGNNNIVIIITHNAMKDVTKNTIRHEYDDISAIHPPNTGANAIANGLNVPKIPNIFILSFAKNTSRATELVTMEDIPPPNPWIIRDRLSMNILGVNAHP